MELEFFCDKDHVFKNEINIRINGEWKSMEDIDDNNIEILSQKLMSNNMQRVAISSIMAWIGTNNHREVLAQFIRCNWGRLDKIMDVDINGSINLEKVQCNNRKNCPYNGIICIK